MGYIIVSAPPGNLAVHEAAHAVVAVTVQRSLAYVTIERVGQTVIAVTSPLRGLVQLAGSASRSIRTS